MTNYFELYQIPVSFHPDPAAVKQKFYELSRKYHPDRFSLADDTAQAEALRMSALNNDAYKTLTNANATMAYVLRLHDILEEEEKYSLPPDFLMEMMELNEAVSDYEMEPENETNKQLAVDSMRAQEQQWEQETGPLLQQFDKGEYTDVNDLLQRIKEQYFRRKYLLRIQQRIDTFATH